MTQVRIDIPYPSIDPLDALYGVKAALRGDEVIRYITGIYETLLRLEFKNDDYLFIMEQDHVIVDFENPANAIIFKLSLDL